MSGDVQTDLSGNPILKDVGPWLKSEIKKRFKDADVKYIDPSYLIRSIPTTSNDRIYCKILAHNAVHAAFAGFTGVTVGLVNTHYVILPIPVVIQAPRRVSLHLRLLTHTYTFNSSSPKAAIHAVFGPKWPLQHIGHCKAIRFAFAKVCMRTAYNL